MFFKRISIIGLGLIGASLASALQAFSNEKNSEITILGYDNNFKAKEKKEILKYGIDEYETDFKYLCATDLVILCAPVEENVKLLRKIKRFLGSKTLVVDASSTKLRLCEVATEEGINFIGLHPIAGSELSGYQNSNPNLFKGKPFIISPQPDTNQEEFVNNLKELIEGIGSIPGYMSPKEHDEIFARLSHLPQLVSTLLINTCQDNLQFSGTGLADVSRLAGSPWHVWRDILSTNKSEIVQALNDFKAQISLLNDALENDNLEWIQTQFETANANYHKLKKIHSA